MNLPTRRREGGGHLAVLVLIAVLATAPTAWAASIRPSLPSASPGYAFEALGAGWRTGLVVRVTFLTPAGARIAARSARADRLRRVNLPFVVPGSATPGRYRLVAVQGRTRATGVLRVTARPPAATCVLLPDGDTPSIVDPATGQTLYLDEPSGRYLPPCPSAGTG